MSLAGVRKVVHIGLPELSEEELTAIAELAHETVVERIRDSLSSSDIIDINVVVKVVEDDTLDLAVDAYVEVPVFVDADVEGIVNEAIELAYERVERELRRKAGEERNSAETSTREARGSDS